MLCLSYIFASSVRFVVDCVENRVCIGVHSIYASQQQTCTTVVMDGAGRSQRNNSTVMRAYF